MGDGPTGHLNHVGRLGRYGAAMAILRDADPRIGCLAVPLSAVAGFVLFALVAAAIGAGSGLAGLVGIGGLVVGIVVAAVTLRG